MKSDSALSALSALSAVLLVHVGVTMGKGGEEEGRGGFICLVI